MHSYSDFMHYGWQGRTTHCETTTTSFTPTDSLYRYVGIVWRREYANTTGSSRKPSYKLHNNISIRVIQKISKLTRQFALGLHSYSRFYQRSWVPIWYYVALSMHYCRLSVLRQELQSGPCEFFLYWYRPTSLLHEPLITTLGPFRESLLKLFPKQLHCLSV